MVSSQFKINNSQMSKAYSSFLGTDHGGANARGKGQKIQTGKRGGTFSYLCRQNFLCVRESIVQIACTSCTCTKEFSKHCVTRFSFFYSPVNTIWSQILGFFKFAIDEFASDYRTNYVEANLQRPKNAMNLQMSELMENNNKMFRW